MVSHILVIDDQISLSRFIAMELHVEGYQVSVNCDDVAELSMIQKLNPDLIVLNWELRRTSAFDICRQLRLVGNQVPIVVVTAKDESSCRSALKLGAQTCLTKPFLMNDLLKTIENHLKYEKQM
ncbi:MAG: response regulator transcription factor [Microcoleus sp. SIO2G3]|nr:response regulator transcription factor [Microcoleus sp. SIO2G3]